MPGGKKHFIGHRGDATILGSDEIWKNDNQYLVLAANDKITLKEGFHAQNGSYFHAITYDLNGGNVKYKSGGISEKELTGDVKFIDTTKVNEVESESVETREITSISKTEGYSGFRFYPNPNSGRLYVENFNGHDKIKIMDLNGKIIMEVNEISSTSHIDLHSVPNGVYILIVESNHDTGHEKLVVNRGL